MRLPSFAVSHVWEISRSCARCQNGRRHICSHNCASRRVGAKIGLFFWEDLGNLGAESELAEQAYFMQISGFP